jgi:hypothetical protein
LLTADFQGEWVMSTAQVLGQPYDEKREFVEAILRKHGIIAECEYHGDRSVRTGADLGKAYAIVTTEWKAQADGYQMFDGCDELMHHIARAYYATPEDCPTCERWKRD